MVLSHLTSLLSQTCKYSWNASRRHYALLATLPEFTFDKSVADARQMSKRSFSGNSIIQKCMPNIGVVKKPQLLGLNIDHVAEEDMMLILKPYLYVASVPKKDSKSALIKGFNYWMNIPTDLCETIEQLFTILYECELMLDDVYDESNYRRGLPTAHKLYGISQTHIGGKVCLFLALKKLIELDNMKAIEAFADEFIKNYVGQYKEIYMRDNAICPTLEEYEQICVNKTEPVISIIVKFMQAFSDCKTDFTHLSRTLGIYYQYLNDFSILCEPKCWNAKGFCQDISEGKYSLAVIHAIYSGTQEGDLVSAILQQKTKDVPTLKYCLSLLEKLGSIDFARETVKKAENELKNEMERLGGNPLLLKYVDALATMKYDEETDNTYLQDSWSQ